MVARIAELILHEVRKQARAEGEVGGDEDRRRGGDGELLVAISEGGSVQLGYAMDKVAEVDGFAVEAEGAAIGFSKVEGSGDDVREAVEVFDGAGDEFGGLFAVFEGERDFEAAADGGDGAFEVVRDGVGEGAELVYRGGDAVEHVVEGAGEARDFVLLAADGDAGAKVVRADAGGSAGDGVDALEHAPQAEQGEEEAEGDHEDPAEEETQKELAEQVRRARVEQAEIEATVARAHVEPNDAKGLAPAADAKRDR